MKKILLSTLLLLTCLVGQAQSYELLYRYEMAPEGRYGYAGVIGVKCNGLIDVVVPKQVYKDGIPCTVTLIEQKAFRGCTQLRWFRYEGGENINIEPAAFEGCTSLESCDLSNVRITNYGIGMFKGCTKLKNVKLRDIIAFGDSMFEGCTSLEELHIPYGCTYAYKSAFKGCENLILFSDYHGIPKGFSADDNPCTPMGLLVIPEGEDKSAYGDYDNRTQGYAKAFTAIMTKSAWENGGKEPIEEGPLTKPSVTMNNIHIDEGGKVWTSNLYRGLTVVYDMTVKDFPTDDVWVTIRFFNAKGQPLEAVNYAYRDSKGRCCTTARLYRNTYNPARFRNQHLQIPYNAVWRGYGPKTVKYRIEVSGEMTGVLWKSKMKTITISNNKYIRTR